MPNTPGYLPRFGRASRQQNDDDLRRPAIRRPATEPAIQTSSRLEGPPIFGDPIAPQMTPPPSYAQIRSLSQSELTSLVARQNPYHGTVGQASRAVTRISIHPAISNTLDTLEDIQHSELRYQVHLDNRLSSVPNYPIFLEPTPTSSRRRPSRRPSSINTTSTAGLIMSVSQLPGSEQFDDDHAAYVSYEVGSLGPSSAPSPLSPVSPLSAFEASVAQIMTVQRVQAASARASREPRQTSWFMDTSPNFADRWDAPATGYYSPDMDLQSSIHSNQTWPLTQLEQRAALQKLDPRIQSIFRTPRSGVRDVNTPPVPPPKDPGYVAGRPTRKRKGNTMHRSHSSPQSGWFRPSDRTVHDRAIASQHKNSDRGDANAPRIKETKKSSKKSTHLLTVCARFIKGSSIPVAVSC